LRSTRRRAVEARDKGVRLGLEWLRNTALEAEKILHALSALNANGGLSQVCEPAIPNA
jgi:hypothetical protein